MIFALDAIHCDTLNNMFRKRGIRSDYVYTLRSDEENQKAIDSFRNNDKPDGIDVLININILTEGSDIPDIETIFLTRPTSSDVLLMQMVGRGMRGVESGGTETLNVVDFCDKWPNIVQWLNPEFLLGQEMEIIDPEKRKQKQYSLIPMQMVRAIAKGISYKNCRANYKNASLPVGWFDVTDEDGNDTKIIVFEDQLTGYRNMKKDMNFFIENENLDEKNVITAYFRNMGTTPQLLDLSQILLYIRTAKEFPEYHKFYERDLIDPCKIAQEIKKEDLKISEIKGKITEEYNKNPELINSIYSSYEEYQERVMNFLLYEDGKPPIGTRIEEVEKKFYKLSPREFKKPLEQLLTDVIELMKEQLPQNFKRPAIYWTDRDYGSYFGKYNHETNEIFINNMLNSESIDEEPIKFVIYHECLHQEIHGHGPEFREKERKYPNFLDCKGKLECDLKDYYID